MKNLIPLLNAAAALSLLASASSCTKTRIDIGSGTGTYIEFASALTKAPVNSADDMTEFAVWATFNANGSVETPMYNTKVYRADDNRWTYDELQPWEEGNWNFEAIYPLPEILSTTGIAIGKDAMEVNFTMPKEGTSGPTGLNINYYYGPAASHDLMLASHGREYTAGSPDSSPVVFTFGHLLSKISIAVKASGNVSLESLAFSGMSVLGEYNTMTSGTGKWHILTGIPELSNVPPGSFPAELENITKPLPDGTPVTIIQDLLLIPQTPGGTADSANPVKVSVSYIIGDGEVQSQDVYLPVTTSWESGKHYKYTLAIGGATATLTVKVVEWDEQDFSVEF